MAPGYGLNAEGIKFTPIEWSWVADQLERSRNYWVATTRRNGRPHVAPVWGLWLSNRFMFATDAESVKAKNAARDPACSVHLESGDDVVILDGALEPVSDESHLKAFVDAYDKKYSIQLEINSDAAPVFALRHSTVLAWKESDFPSTATRWKFE